MPVIRQTSFIGGELDPKLWGRTDLPRFQVGMRRLSNFFVSKNGAAVSRPGTVYLGNSKCQTDRVRLIPFVYSDTESFVLEVGQTEPNLVTNSVTHPNLEAKDIRGKSFTLPWVPDGPLWAPAFTVLRLFADGSPPVAVPSTEWAVIVRQVGAALVGTVTFKTGGAPLPADHVSFDAPLAIRPPESYTVQNPVVCVLNGKSFPVPFEFNTAELRVERVVNGVSSVVSPSAYFVDKTLPASIHFLSALDVGVLEGDHLVVSTVTTGGGYMRFWRDGARVLDGIVPYELSTPWNRHVDLAQLRCAQSGNVLLFTHPDVAPRELRRIMPSTVPNGGWGTTPTVAPDRWELTEVSYSRPLPYWRDIAAPHTPTAAPYLVTPLPVADSSHPAREWTYKASAIVQDTETGALFETLAETVGFSYNGVDPVDDGPGPGGSTAPAPSTICVYADKAVTLQRPTTPGLQQAPPSGNTYKPVAFNFYRGRGGLFGFIGQTRGRTFVDVGSEPDYLRPPPQGRNPFAVYNYQGALVRTESPGCAAYYQERRLFGGTRNRPAWLFASATGDYYDFDVHIPMPLDSALEFELAARRREEIRALVPLARLLVLTSSSVWAVSGHQGQPLTGESVDAAVVEDVGVAAGLPPLVVDANVLYARTKGTGVRALLPTQGPTGYSGRDVSSEAEHLFASPIRDWCYQEDPYGLVWAVRRDGVLLSLTFLPEAGVWAWTRHEMDGDVLAVASVPEGTEDAVYLYVRRSFMGRTLYQVERMASRREAKVCTDSSFLYSGVCAQTLTHPRLAEMVGKTVFFTGENLPVYGPLHVAPGGVVTLSEVPKANDGTQLKGYFGLPFLIEAETLDVASAEVRLRQKTVVSVGVEVDSSMGLWVGQDFDHLEEWRRRKVGDGYGLIGSASEVVRVAVAGKWDASARCAIRQRLPLPLTLLGVARELDIGGT